MKRKLLVVFVVLVACVAGGFVADRKLKERNHPGLATFLGQWWRNYPASFAVEPLELSLHVDRADLDALEEVVNAARERGVIMPEGNDYVSAVLGFEGKEFKGKVRIKGKMADHVDGSKWSFRVVSKKDKGFLGMQRFSLQHPGTRNYLCDWFFHRLMKGEGAIALRYGFIRLKFNDEDLGIYAYEEHFGPELLENNGRVKGPLFRFDPGLFWEHRLNMIDKVRYNEPYGVYQAAALDPFGAGELEKDTAQLALFEEAISLMDGFRRARLTASQVFDADQLGRRHAMLDLVGGHHSMDWSDVKFYYDPLIKRIEPVAYESFSAFPIRTLAGSDRFVGDQDPAMDLHDAYFNDPDVFSAYVHHLERISRPSFLDSVFTALGPALDSASALIYREFPYKELDRSIYNRNQLIIRKILDVPKGFHAYSNGVGDTAHVVVVPLEGLPMEIHGLVGANGKVIPPTRATIVPCRMPGEVGTPMDVLFVMKGDGKEGPTLKLRYSVLGASVEKELEVFPYAYLDGLHIPSVAPPAAYDLRAVPFVAVDDEANVINILPGNWVVDRDVFLPTGYRIEAHAPLRLDMRNGARVVSRSSMSWSGSEDAAIVIASSDRSGGGFVLLDTRGQSSFEHIRWEGFGNSPDRAPAILAQMADVDFKDCEFGEVRDRDLLTLVRCKAGFTSSSFTGGSDQLTLAFCSSKITDVEMNGAGDDAVSVKGGKITAIGITVNGSIGSGLKLDELAEGALDDVRIQAKKDAIDISEGSRMKLTGGALSSVDGSALSVHSLHERHGSSHVDLVNVDFGSAKVPLNIGNGNRVTVDGKAMDALSTKAAK